MQVTGARIRNFDIPFRKTYKNSLAAKSVQKSVVFIIETDEGITGISSIEPDTPNYSEETWYEICGIVENEFVPVLQGNDPRNIELIYDQMEKRVFGHYMSKALVETALFDLLAKSLGAPVYRIRGGRYRETANVIGWVGLGTEKERISEVSRFLDEGFICIKLKTDTRVSDLIELLKKLRSNYGYSFSVRIDANQCLSRKTAHRLSGEIAKFEIEHLEQPLDRNDIAGMRQLSRVSPVSVMADESAATLTDVRRLIQEDACSAIKLKVMRAGGIMESERILALAKAGGIGCVIGNGFSTSLSTAIESQFFAYSSYLNPVPEFVGPSKLKNDIVKNPIEIRAGILRIPEGNGFGYDSRDLIQE